MCWALGARLLSLGASRAQYSLHPTDMSIQVLYNMSVYKMALAGTVDGNVSAPFCVPNASQQPIGVHSNYANQFNCLDRQAIGGLKATNSPILFNTRVA